MSNGNEDTAHDTAVWHDPWQVANIIGNFLILNIN